MSGMDIIAGVINIDKVTKIPFCLEAGGIFVCAFDESEKTGTRDLSPCPKKTKGLGAGITFKF
ncbi:hypothetical protein SPX_42550 [Sporomusa paucivorans]